MKVIGTPIEGAFVLESQRHTDERGWFERAFCADVMQRNGLERTVAQANHSCTAKAGTVRGMHFQRSPNAETKLVRCIGGECFDVVVDLRQGSATFLRWFGVPLNPLDGRALYVPRGCAHGFQALRADTHLLYFSSHPYSPSAEGAVHPQDPRIGIAWPMTIALMSAKDASQPMLTSSFEGLAP